MQSSGGNLFCEVCGIPIRGPYYHAEVDGAEMILCPSCYARLSRSGRAALIRRRERRPKRVVRPRPRRPRAEVLELVDDYAERIREAREAKGWSTAVLAQKLKISESMLKKIEQGKLKPQIEVAKRIERVLKITILVPAIDEEDLEEPPPREGLTLGDIVVIRKDED